MPDTANIHVTIVDGRRQPLAPDTEVLMRLLGGAQQFPGWWAKGGDINLNDIPFTDTGRDAYYVFASAKGYADSVTPYPVALKRGATVEAQLLATPKDGTFHFLKWEDFQKADKNTVQLISTGAADPGKRYTDTLEAQPMQLGALLNLATAIGDIPLDNQKNPLESYYWEVMWDLLAPDRFWAWVDARLADRIRDLAKLHAFAPESGSAGWHPAMGTIGAATRSWKQTRFEVANVQLTFHETTKSTRKDAAGNAVDCVVVEPDIDLYKDLVAHGLTEVIPNLVSGGKTDPRLVYAMRWMATRQETGVVEFDPPCTIE
jgi:hypothetical protein